MLGSGNLTVNARVQGLPPVFKTGHGMAEMTNDREDLPKSLPLSQSFLGAVLVAALGALLAWMIQRAWDGPQQQVPVQRSPPATVTHVVTVAAPPALATSDDRLKAAHAEEFRRQQEERLAALERARAADEAARKATAALAEAERVAEQEQRERLEAKAREQERQQRQDRWRRQRLNDEASSKTGEPELQHGILHLEVEPEDIGGLVWVDGQYHGAASGTKRLPAGKHVVEIRSVGCRPVVKQVDLRPGVVTRLAVRLTGSFCS
jgi:hypothetical protein